MSRITSITTSNQNASKVVIHVDGRAAATLPAKQVEALGIAVDGEWSEKLAAKVTDAVTFEAAFDQTMRMLNRRRLSRAMVEAKLKERGHEPGVIESVIAKVASIGAIDDASLARDLVDEIDRTRPAGPALKRAKLARRGVGEDVIEKIVEREADPKRQIADARRLIASKMKSMARLDETTRKRRLWGLLARRGFDEETIDAVLGE